MAKLSADAPALMSSWAVAKIPGDLQVAIKFNDLPPVLMSAEEASEFAAAVNAELGDAHSPAVRPRWPALEHARDLLMTAAESGKRKDVVAATDQVAIALGQRKRLGD